MIWEMVLLKAVDFLFGEGSKMISDIRNRRKLSAESAPNPTGGILSPEDARKASVNESKASSIVPEVEHLLNLLDIHKANYYLAREQFAKYGPELAPPILMHRLKDAEDAIRENMEELRISLERVYGGSASSTEGK